MNKKQVIRLNQNQFKQIVKEATDRILNPAYPEYKPMYGENDVDIQSKQGELSEGNIQSISNYIHKMCDDISGVAKMWDNEHNLRDLDYLYKRLDYLVGLIKDNAGM